jgi:hypothetical protein
MEISHSQGTEVINFMGYLFLLGDIRNYENDQRIKYYKV